jgi:hypothetical protein
VDDGRMARIARGAVVELAAEIDDLHDWYPLKRDRMAAGLARNAGAFQVLPQDSHQAGNAATVFCASARETTKTRGRRNDLR